MRKYLLILCVLCSCKAKQPVAKNREVRTEKEMDGCVFSKLPKTVNYCHEIKVLKEVYMDTVVQLESCTFKGTEYRTVFDLKKSSRFLWLIRETNTLKSDSILIECLTATKSVESYFDLERCEIEKTVSEFYANGNPKHDFTRLIKLVE